MRLEIMPFQKDHLPFSKRFQLQLLKFSFLLSSKLAFNSGVKLCKYQVLLVVPNKTHRGENIVWFSNPAEVKLQVYLYSLTNGLRNDSGIQSKPR